MADDQDWTQRLGLDRLPRHTIDKRLSELIDLSGKKAIVTGAGGDGLGQAIANRFAGMGADVAILGRTASKVEKRAAEIEEKWGVKAVPVTVDLSDWDQVHRAVKESHDALGGLDIMVNNPVMVVGGPFARHSKEDIDFTVHGSLTMLMYGAHAALEYMLPQGHGRIINIASEAGRVPQRYLVVYGAAKAGVIGFTRNLAHEVAPTGVTVMCVAPGIMMKPDLQEKVLNPRGDQDMVARESVRETIEDQVQLGRAGLPEEVANMVAYVASPAADYMTGQTLDVSGGMYMN